MGKKQQARKRLAKQKQVVGATSNKISDSDWLVLNVFGVFSFLLIYLVSAIEEVGTNNYYHSQNGLFILSCLFILVFVAGKNLNIQIYDSAKKVIQTPDTVSKRDMGNILLGVAHVIAFVTLFVIDLSFLPNYGLRISGVVAVNTYVLLRNLFYPRKG